MSPQATMVATCRAHLTDAAEVRADWIEWRADLLGDLASEELRRHGAKLLYSLRSELEGGRGPNDQEWRAARLKKAARDFDFIELEGNRDLTPAILEHIPEHRRVISWHGHATDPLELLRLFSIFARASARLYRLVIWSEQIVEALATLQFLNALGRDDVIAYAESSPMAWTRPLAARAGAPVVFGEMANGHRQSTDLSALRRDYGLPALHRVTELCAIVGRAVQGSPSPQLHNAAYRAQGASRLFVKMSAESFDGFWKGVIEPSLFEEIGLRMRGITVASPHKKPAVSVAGEVSATSRLTESANVMFRRGSKWHADSTDADGVLMNLADAGLSCAGRRVAVIGCGGSGRPIAAALRDRGAHVTLVNRGMARGHWAADLLRLPFQALDRLRPSEFDLIVNATPLGRDSEEMPLDFTQLPSGSVIVDLAYSEYKTAFSSAARRCGHMVIDGHRILLAQVARQYRLMTGEEMPKSVAGEFAGAEESETVPAFQLDRKTLDPVSFCEPLPT